MGNYIIIGGSSGIGKALTEKLSSQQHSIWVSYLTHAPTEEHNQIKYFKWDAIKDHGLEMTDIPEVIDGLVYCPGSIILKPFGRLAADDFEKDFKINVMGAIACIQAALPYLKKSNQASIVLFSTVAAQLGLNFHSLVPTSKGAIEGLVKSLAAEFAPKIRVNAIAPSLTDTPLAEQLLSTPEKREANAMRHPLKKIGTATDIANMAEFLLSEKSAWMTGQILHVDGGISCIKI